LLTETGNGNEGFKPSGGNHALALLPEYHDVGGIKTQLTGKGFCESIVADAEVGAHGFRSKQPLSRNFTKIKIKYESGCCISRTYRKTPR
jgi:hypothetical protein